MRRDLPSGTVTFLFTDVEGSTLLLHSLGAEGYAEALAEHRRVIREACAAEGGVEVDTQGDAFFFAFPTAPGAVAAASALTDALASGSIRVRVGLHTGTPLVTHEGYVGDDVHFAARVAASGHGGQVICSDATAALVELPLTDLGEHRLKDIAGAVSIFQLGNGTFPPLKTISNTNLPRSASSFVGRAAEVVAVLSRIENGARLVTLTGPGGSGKTRLAIEAAAALVPEYQAGVFWVGLAPLRDPALVTETIAQTLGAKDGLAEHIGERELLLLLDNLEQVIEASPELASLLERCPNLTLLVTSRELLRVRGEVEYEVPPLAEPEAVALFCERAQLEPTEEIAELCARLDNLPLAVELAAARTKALSPAQILERLSQRLDLLKGGRDAVARQQTLRATIEWSYELLSEEERQLFARLSVFVGGCTLEAAEEVADADLDTLQSLVEKSLLRFTDGRYWMLETIRAYAEGVLDHASERYGLRRRLAQHVVALALETRAGVRVGDAADMFARIDAELANVRSVRSWLEERSHRDELCELVAATKLYWALRGFLREGLLWAERALAMSDRRDDKQAGVLFAAASFAGDLGDLIGARTYAEECLAITREVGSASEVASVLGVLGHTLADLGDHEEAEDALEEAAALARQEGRADLAASTLANMSDLALRRHDYERARRASAEALALFRGLGDEQGIGWASYNLAFAYYGESDNEKACEYSSSSLVASHNLGDTIVAVWSLNLIAALLVRRNDPAAAGTLLGAADAVVEQSGYTLGGAEAELRRRTELAVRDGLQTAGCAEVLARGFAMALDEAVEYALASLD
jgi:predicted ATPase